MQTERKTKFYLSFSEVQPIFEAAKQAQRYDLVSDLTAKKTRFIFIPEREYLGDAVSKIVQTERKTKSPQQNYPKKII